MLGQHLFDFAGIELLIVGSIYFDHSNVSVIFIAFHDIIHTLCPNDSRNNRTLSDITIKHFKWTLLSLFLFFCKRKNAQKPFSSLLAGKIALICHLIKQNTQILRKIFRSLQILFYLLGTFLFIWKETRRKQNVDRIERKKIEKTSCESHWLYSNCSFSAFRAHNMWLQEIFVLY